jgi:hypothetical protein
MPARYWTFLIKPTFGAASVIVAPEIVWEAFVALSLTFKGSGARPSSTKPAPDLAQRRKEREPERPSSVEHRPTTGTGGRVASPPRRPIAPRAPVAATS